MTDRTKHIYDRGIVGNCSYFAYIDTEASVVWMCVPRFDSPFLFGSLVDKKKGGEFSIRPVEDHWTTKQSYLKNANVLCTEFTTPRGLFSGHVDREGGLWGNFPQTCSHVGLMNAAYQIARSLNNPSFL